MHIDYQIVSFHRPTASIQVRYFNADLPDGIMFALNLPVVNGQLPRGEALEQLVKSHAPRDAFERAAALRNADVPDELSHVAAPAAPASIDQFLEGQLFVHEDRQRIFLIRPLIEEQSLDIPLEVI